MKSLQLIYRRGLFLFAFVLTISAFPIHAMPDAGREGISAVKLWVQQHRRTAEEDFQKWGIPRQESPAFWGDKIIYQIQVDRFNNGNPHNDHLNLNPAQTEEIRGGNLYGILDYRHGGDLTGILERLDYIKDLGATTLWLTPVLKHSGTYHGYCTSNFTEIDPGFGTKEDLRELVRQAHLRGISVVMDIVINHMCDSLTQYRKSPDHYRCSGDLSSANWNGLTSRSEGQGELAFSDQFFPLLKTQHFFNRCGANSQHDMEGTEPAAVYGDFVAEMLDFDTRNYDFQEIFTELHKYWIAYADIDGFRLDAAKHVSEDFIAYFSTHSRDYAKSLGKNNFLIVGEVAGPSDWVARRLGKMYSNPKNPDDHGSVPQALTQRLLTLKEIYLQNPQAPYPGMTAAFEFAHGGTARDVLQGQRSPKSLEDFFRSSYFSDIASQNDHRLNWNLLEIHDWPRFASTDKHNSERLILGLAYLSFAEGPPVIYYGMEQGFNGDCHFDKMKVGSAVQQIQAKCQGYSHALYRQDMFMGGMTRLGSTVDEINQLAYIGPASLPSKPISWQQDPYLNRTHNVYQSARRFLHIRKSCAPLKYGGTQFRWVSHEGQGILAFSRADKSDSEALIVLNTSPNERPLPEIGINDQSQGNKWVNLLHPQEIAWTTGHGSLSFKEKSISGYGIMVFIPEVRATDYDPYLGAARCTDQ